MCLFALSAMAKTKCPPQGTRLTAAQYTDKYAAYAQEQQRKYGVPASITLAQGMLESAYGSSYLAVVANNHFGIKAYRWKGATVTCDDDYENEKFCKFKSVAEGYEYHSTFLRDNTRYAPLFKLDIDDYEAWAHGLKQCGYATNPKYAQLLINIIEQNHLDVYDALGKSGKKGYTLSNLPHHKLYTTARRRGLKYTLALDNDDLSYIAMEYGVSERKLRRWNDLPRLTELRQGDIIYLQGKRGRATKGYDYHIVKAGESMQSISQIYGVKVKSLMKLNKLVSATVQEGQILKLR